MDRAGQWPQAGRGGAHGPWCARPVVGGRTVVRLGRTAVRDLVRAAVRVFLLRLLVFRRFLLFLLYNADQPRPMGDRIHSISILYSII